jgi:hypothetical protein
MKSEIQNQHYPTLTAFARRTLLFTQLSHYLNRYVGPTVWSGPLVILTQRETERGDREREGVDLPFRPPEQGREAGLAAPAMESPAVVTKSGMSTSVPNRTRGVSNHGRRCTVTSRPHARHPWLARHRWPRGTAARRGREEVLRVWHGVAKVVVRLIGTGREHHNSWGGKALPRGNGGAR